MIMIIRKCPMCEKEYTDYPAISRTMGKEEICSECGQKQAVQSFIIATAPCYQTRSIAQWIEEDSSNKCLEFVITCHKRHIHFEWGEMDKEDKHYNDIGIVTGDRLFSSYKIPYNLQEEFGFEEKSGL